MLHLSVRFMRHLLIILGYLHFLYIQLLNSCFNVAKVSLFRLLLRMLPGLVKVFSSVGHSTGGSKALTQRSSGHIHELLLLLGRTATQTVRLYRSLSSVRQRMDCFVFSKRTRAWDRGPICAVDDFGCCSVWTRRKQCWQCLQQRTNFVCQTERDLLLPAVLSVEIHYREKLFTPLQI